MLALDDNTPSVSYSCPTQRTLCYRPLSDSDLSSPVFPLHLHPHQFLCAQVPGLTPADHYLVQWINPRNPKAGISLLDIVGYERQLLTSLEFLLTEVIPRAKETFPILDDQYVQSLTFLWGCHRKWLNRLDEVLQTRNRASMDDVVKALIEIAELSSAEQDYAEQLDAIKPALVEASMRYSPAFAVKLGGLTIHQAMLAPLRWRGYVARSSKGLASALVGKKGPSPSPKSMLAVWITTALLGDA
jgi:hypothetical protein